MTKASPIALLAAEIVEACSASLTAEADSAFLADVAQTLMKLFIADRA